MKPADQHSEGTLKKDLAAETLTEIADIWKVDHARTIETKDGFDWWPGDYRVSVSAMRRTDGHVPETWMLSVRTDFLKDIPLKNERFVKLAAFAGGNDPPTFAWVFPPAEVWREFGTPGNNPKLWFANTAFLTAENVSWLPRFLAEMSILQPIEARMAPYMPKALGGGEADITGSELLGRTTQQDLLHREKARYVAYGDAPNRWIATGEFEAIAKNWNGLNQCICNGNDSQFTLEMHPGKEPPLIILSTNQKHPQLGHGLLAELMLPIVDDKFGIAQWCATKNLAETMWTDIPQFGCWYPYPLANEQARSVFSSFIPNALYGPGIASLVVHWLYQRFRMVTFGEYPT